MSKHEKKSKLEGLQVVLLLCGMLLFIVLVTARFGDVQIPLQDFFAIIGSKIPIIADFIDMEGIPKGYVTIVILRFRRIILSMLCGMGLSYAGVIYQSVFKNPMAEPYLLGVSSGAALGATIGTILAGTVHISFQFLGFGTIHIFAFIGALLALFIVFSLGATITRASMGFLLLVGLAINYFISSIISLLIMLHQQQLEEVYFWTMGSFQTSQWEEIFLVGILLLVVVFLSYPEQRTLDIMLLGDEQASALGVDVVKTKKRLLIASSLLSAGIVSSVGIIGFVGLIVPHFTRIIVGPKHKKLLPYSMVFGGVFLTIADTVARSVLDRRELSVGIITSLIGVPFFIYMLIRDRKGK